MITIDMTTIHPVGEFGSKAWCQACADYGTRILEQSDLPSDLSWGFSEIYTHAPERLLSPDRKESGYHFRSERAKFPAVMASPCRALNCPDFMQSYVGLTSVTSQLQSMAVQAKNKELKTKNYFATKSPVIRESNPTWAGSLIQYGLKLSSSPLAKALRKGRDYTISLRVCKRLPQSFPTCPQQS